MFYTLVSRTIITRITTPRDYLYIFLIGSVGYVVLHWYLYMEKKEGIMEKVREYLYYAMVLDMITAIILLSMYPSKSDKTENEEDNNNEDQKNEDHNDNNNNNNNEHQKLLMQKMQEARRYQQMKQRELELERENNNRNVDRNIDGNDDTNNKKSIFTKNDESVKQNQTNDKKKVEHNRVENVENVENNETDKTTENNDNNDENDENDENNKNNESNIRTNCKTKTNSKKTEIIVKNKKNTDSKDSAINDTDIPIFEAPVPKQESKSKQNSKKKSK